MTSLPDRQDIMAGRRAAAELRRGLAEVSATYEADRLSLLRGYVAETVRAVCLPLLDLQEADEVDIDAELRAMRPPDTWPWSGETQGSSDAPRMPVPRLLHVVRQRSADHHMLALHVNGPSVDMVSGIAGGTVWTRHGQGRIRMDDHLHPDDVGRNLDVWCPDPPFHGQGYRISDVIWNSAVGSAIGHFKVGWIDYRAPWAR